jgi:hypothetical protein
MDSGDKAANKAMSVAHKYALLQALCIPTEEMADPDRESFEVAKKQGIPSPMSQSTIQPRQETSSELDGLMPLEKFNIKNAWSNILMRCDGDLAMARNAFKRFGADTSKDITYEIYQKVFHSLLRREHPSDGKEADDPFNEEIPFTSSKTRVTA